MRPRRYYGAGFLLVLVAAIFGAFLACQAVGRVEAPNLDGLSSAEQTLEELNIWALLPLPAVAPRSTPTPTVDGARRMPQAGRRARNVQPIVVAPADQPDATHTSAEGLEAPALQETAISQPESAATATRPPATPT